MWRLKHLRNEVKIDQCGTKVNNVLMGFGIEVVKTNGHKTFLHSCFNCLLLGLNCTNYMCTNGEFRPTTVRCNNANDCGDGSDEVGCGKMQ